MSSLRLILDSLRHHLRGNLAVLLGVLVGSTVLTGALLVGDSLQGSLRDRSLRQLGWVDQALVSPRLFRAGLAGELANRTGERVSAALILRTTVQIAGDAPDRSLVRGVQVLGVDDAFFDRDAPGGVFAWANAELARDLRLRPGQSLDVRLVQPSALPREAVLARKDLGIRPWRVEVTRILEGDEAGNHFQPWPSLDAPRNLLVPLSLLQEQLESAGMANTLFASSNVASLQAALGGSARLEDYGLTLYTPAGRARSLLQRYDRNKDGQLRGAEWFRRVDGKRKPRFAAVEAEGMKPAKPDVLTASEITEYYEREHPNLCLESKQLLLSSAVVRAAEEAASKTGLEQGEALVYLCRMESQGQKVAGVVAALSPDRPPPLGPFLPGGATGLADDEILLADEGWPAGGRPRVGDAVELIYKSPESHGPSEDQRRTFKLAGFLPMRGVSADPSLTPEFPGITDKEDAGDWTLPFDDPAWQQQAIRREYTDVFWDRYRATPKAYITLASGQKMWSSRFGSVTSIRLAPKGVAVPTSHQLEQAADRFRQELLKSLVPEQSGLVFSPVKEEALKASKGGT
ncbi:MAG: ABC transporter permease, partial [Gemmataceae bacterium]